MSESVESKILGISEDYFSYLAKNFPVMCLSDEFYFFPQIRNACNFLNLLDSLDAEKIKEAVSYVKTLKKSLDTLNLKDIDLESEVDLSLLNQSISTFLREFDRQKIWQIDPGLYLKISLIGIHQIIDRFSFIRPDIETCLRDRLSEIPRLLSEAKNNIKKAPQASLEVASEMIISSIEYFKTGDFQSELKDPLKKALIALEDFGKFLAKRPSSTVFIKDRKVLEDILKDSFSYTRDLDEIFEIASEEYRKTIKELERLSKKINPSKSWQEILSIYKIEADNADELLRLYSGQIEKIKDFLYEKNALNIPGTQKISVRFTPEFLRPFRASASYSSPVTDDSREPAYFYITVDFSNIHNEYIFVTAHETYPGHHLLDSVRRGLANPIRQQIESPLFYEGWASYAERLIDELGYLKDPLQKLLGLKRQAWRAVRAMLDVGIRIGRLEFKDAGILLRDLGYEPKTVKFMVRHYSLSPGYQLCYTMGKFEIDRLKEKFSSRLGLKRFHSLLLEGGQINFALIEKRIKDRLCRKDS